MHAPRVPIIASDKIVQMLTMQIRPLRTHLSEVLNGVCRLLCAWTAGVKVIFSIIVSSAMVNVHKSSAKGPCTATNTVTIRSDTVFVSIVLTEYRQPISYKKAV